MDNLWVNKMNEWNYDIFWKEALKQIREKISEIDNSMWFKNIRYYGSGKNKIILSVPSTFYKEQVTQKFSDLILSTISELTGSVMEIEFIVKQVTTQIGKEENTNGYKESEPKNKVKNSKSKQQITVKDTLEKNSNLRRDYVFDNFVIGESNTFAANACIAISKNPGKAYNPCLIYGGVGLGKTHLIQSIGNYILDNFKGMKVEYVTAEQFTNDFIRLLGEGEMYKFKNKYRKVDVLLIDDIHFLGKKMSTQEELFHTFNALYDYNKQMVFTSDRPVSELKNLTDRLRSRFSRGLNVDLQPPRYETKFAILKQKLETLGTNLDDEILDLICKNVTTNVRDLEAALTKLIAYGELLNKKITMDIAKEQLKDEFSNPRHGNITIDIIQKIVADYFNLSQNDLRGKKRTKAITFPRQIAMYITREITEYSTTEVGVDFGGRDHTTVMHACQRIESKLKSDPSLESIIQNLIRMIKENRINS